LKKEICRLNKHILKIEGDHKEEADRLKRTLDKIFSLFPIIKEWLRIERLCHIIGFSKDIIKELTHRKSVTFSGSLYSPEFQRNFSAEHSTAKVERHTEERDKLQLKIDGVNDTEWFKNKHREFLQKVGVKQKQRKYK